MLKTNFLSGSAVLLAILTTFAGCGKNGALSATQAFDQAPPEIKSDWVQAVAADTTNDYYTASTIYAKVLSQETNLTPKQLEVLESASRDLSQRMVTAANNGDASAKQALMRLMKEQNGR
jgi:predicted small lipoprotein YifL